MARRPTATPLARAPRCRETRPTLGPPIVFITGWPRREGGGDPHFRDVRSADLASFSIEKLRQAARRPAGRARGMPLHASSGTPDISRPDQARLRPGAAPCAPKPLAPIPTSTRRPTVLPAALWRDFRPPAQKEAFCRFKVVKTRLPTTPAEYAAHSSCQPTAYRLGLQAQVGVTACGASAELVRIAATTKVEARAQSLA